MAQHYTVTTFRDWGGELSGVKVYNGAITGASIAGFLTEYGALKTALQGITLGTLAKDQWVGDATDISSADAATPIAQRETKLLVTYVGNTSQKKFTLTVPTFDLDGNPPGQGEGDSIALDVSAAMIAFIGAFEQIARSPDSDTETVTVTRLRHVGRNI
jgi:hypothetical protein